MTDRPDPPNAAPIEFGMCQGFRCPRLTCELKEIGSKVVVFTDHLDIHSRRGTIERAISIADVVDVHRVIRFTGIDIKIQPAEGPALVIHGLHNDRAEALLGLLARPSTRPGDPTGDREPRIPVVPPSDAQATAEEPNA